MKWGQTPYNDAYPTCERCYAELRVFTEALSPDEVSNRIGLRPTSQQSAGESRINRLGRSRLIPRSAWFLSSELEVTSRDLRRHLDWLLDKLEPSSNGLIALQEIEDPISMWVHCVWWSRGLHGGPTLWPSQMERLAKLRLECSLEFASYDDEE